MSVKGWINVTLSSLNNVSGILCNEIFKIEFKTPEKQIGKICDFTHH